MIQFSVLDGKRKTIRLGKMNKHRAERIKNFVEDLVEAHMSGQRPMAATAEWVAGLPPVIRRKLERVGLVAAEHQASGPTLGEWLSAYVDGRTDAKPSTRTVWGHTRRNLLDFFGKDKPIDAITPGDADQWRLFLIDQEKLADNTVRRRCGIAKQFFNFARRKRLITDNPFADLKALVQSNRQRDYFVTRQEAQKVLDACPDAEWRLIFALSRFGGLRCPSEHLALTWGDIHWAEGRFTVHSPKTEHHSGGESRQVPLFPEILPHLREVFELAEPGAEYVITRYRRSNQNLSTQLRRIIKRAGLTPWPKLYQNLRASRETELAETFPLHVVCAWIGNSQAVAAKHYLQVTDEHFRQAALPSTGALQNALQQATTLNRNESQAEKEDAPEPAISQAVRDSSTDCDKSDEHLVGATGLEPVTSWV